MRRATTERDDAATVDVARVRRAGEGPSPPRAGDGSALGSRCRRRLTRGDE